MRTLLTALTALMLFATPVVAGDLEDGVAAYEVCNYQNAYRLLKPLAERGNASTQAVIGWMYRAGKGVPEDDTNAVHWYRKAAEQGHPGGQVSLGIMYNQGKGVPEDDAKAVHWWRTSARPRI